MGRSANEPRLRWFQFRLRTLLLLMTLVAIGLMGWRSYLAPYHRQRQTMALIEKLGGRYQTAAADRWQRQLFGQDFQNLTFVDLADCDDPAAYLEHIVALPRLNTLLVGGEKFTDDDLRRLHRISFLRGLVLDTTSVTDEAITALAAHLPQLEIHRSERRARVAFRIDGSPNSQATNTTAPLRQLASDEHFQKTTIAVFTKRADHDLALIRHFRRLQELWLDSGEVTDADMENLRGLAQLEKLRLDSTQVTSAGLVCLQGLRQLRSLSFNHTEIGDAGLVHLANLTNLEELRLVGTRITDRGLVHLKGLSNLKWLELDGTQITDTGLAQLKELTSLTVLWLTNTRVSPRGMAEIRLALKDCQVLP